MGDNESTAMVAPVTATAMVRQPAAVLAEATSAANALAEVIKKKQKPVVFNGEQYLEFEDWQTCGKFYGLTAKVSWTRPIEIGGALGFEAGADVIDNRTGQVVSSAEAMCLNDEDKWSKRTKYEYNPETKRREKVGEVAVPLFQLRSMAQTRACAKALRNVLAWVVVLAGFRPNVAEELTGDEFASASPKANPPATPTKPAAAPAQEAPQPTTSGNEPPDLDVFDTLENELYDACQGDPEMMAAKLQVLTSFPGKDKETGKPTGKMVPGKRTVDELREKGKTAWAGSALKKLREERGR